MAAGPKDCLPCHQERVARHAESPHAKALRPWTGASFAGRTIRERGGTEYSFTDQGVRVRRDAEVREFPIRWAFGSGVQAITPLLELDGKWVELRLSWYRAGDRLGLTPGHDPMPAAAALEMPGIEQTERNAQRCFGCHMTQDEPGVSCQACHTAAPEHLKSPAKANVVRDRSVGLCAKCHRSPDASFVSAMPEADDPRTIRFAPVGFLASRCYRASDGFTCVTCHDPHGEPRKQDANAVCAGCHASPANHGKCPRSTNCTSCHMKSSSPMPGLRFTDHRIRVHPD